MVCKALFFIGSLGLFVGSAFANADFAVIQSLHGKVLINHGKGFVAALDGAVLSPGDQIMVSNKSDAVVAFGNGCQVTIAEPKLMTLGKTAPCLAGEKVGSVGSSIVSPTAVSGGVADGTPQLVGLGFFGVVVATAIITDATISRK